MCECALSVQLVKRSSISWFREKSPTGLLKVPQLNVSADASYRAETLLDCRIDSCMLVFEVIGNVEGDETLNRRKKLFFEHCSYFQWFLQMKITNSPSAVWNASG